MSNKALIFGHTGQDGYYLSLYLKKKGYEISGFSKKKLLIESKVFDNNLNILSRSDISKFIERVEPDHIYYLTAFHNSSQNNSVLPTRDLYELSLQINVDGFLNVLHAILNYKPKCKIFYAASSHIFGDPLECPQNEKHPINPLNVYGQSKALGMEVANYYKKHHDLFCSTGILYNHESILRSNFFFSKKISLGIKNILHNKLKYIKVGSLDSVVDWSYVTDVVEAMFLSLTTSIPHDFIIASGKAHTTRDYVDIAFKSQRLDYKDYVTIDEEFKDNTSPKIPRIGDSSLIKKKTQWQPKFSFYDMIVELMRLEINEKN